MSICHGQEELSLLMLFTIKWCQVVGWSWQGQAGLAMFMLVLGLSFLGEGIEAWVSGGEGRPASD